MSSFTEFVLNEAVTEVDLRQRIDMALIRKGWGSVPVGEYKIVMNGNTFKGIELGKVFIEAGDLR